MKFPRKPIKLAQKFSPEDDEISRKWWYVNKSGYALRRTNMVKGKTKLVRAHREVMEAKLGRPLLATEFCDHINGDKLDNRRENLRVVTKKQNRQNLHHLPFRGASFIARLNKWRARVKDGEKDIHIGLYDSREEAASVAEKKRKELDFLDANPD